jgi:hypothetical protein
VATGPHGCVSFYLCKPQKGSLPAKEAKCFYASTTFTHISYCIVPISLFALYLAPLFCATKRLFQGGGTLDTTRSMLIESLANTISDYRQNEITPITSIHVEKWLNQFEFSDQSTILAEMDSIMKRFYFSRYRVKDRVRSFIKDMIMRTNDPMKLLPHVCFLNVQKTGSSQGAMLDIADEVLRESMALPSL